MTTYRPLEETAFAISTETRLTALEQLTVAVGRFGAVGDGVTDDGPAVRAAIDYVHAQGGGVVDFPAGTYIVGHGGEVRSRRYGALLRSGVILRGESEHLTTIKAAPGSDIDTINTADGLVSRCGVIGLTLDNNNDNQTPGRATGWNLAAWNITGLVVRNVISRNPGTWGLRIQGCDGVHAHNIRCYHGAESNTDGIHFVDTVNVTGGDFWIYTEGDDGLIIEANGRDVSNYTLSNVYSQPNNQLGLYPRGVLLLNDGTAARTLSNISIDGIIVENCSGTGVAVNGGSYKNVRLKGIVRGGCANSGVFVGPGRSGFAGRMEDCEFDFVVTDVLGKLFSVGTANGTYGRNRINLFGKNPGDGKNAVDISNGWRGRIDVDYDPDGTKVSPQNCIAIAGSGNDLAVNTNGGSNGVNLLSGASSNTINVGRVTGALTNGMLLQAGANNNDICGGSISGPISNLGTGNTFNGVRGATKRGQTACNFATLADGTATIPHGLGGTPTWAQAQLRHVSTVAHVIVTGMDANNITVRAVNSNGANITAGTFNILWEASL